jgi:hypothetical protein
MAIASIDNITARNSTSVVLIADGQRVGRVQSFREDISNNVQVLAELGRAFNAEMKKGVTTYTFSIAKFYCRSDVMDQLKLGKVFAISIKDEATSPDYPAGSAVEILETFPRCMIQSLSRDYTIGQASVGENATVVTIGQGLGVPTAG